MQTVYRSDLAVNAHMICDLLFQGGIRAQVLGEYLQTGAGELPLGGLVRVVVDDDRVAEATSLIADWERSAPTVPESELPSAPPGSRRLVVLGSVMFAAGALLGAVVAWAWLISPTTRYGLSADGATVLQRVRISNGVPIYAEVDTDRDGRLDVRIDYDTIGIERARRPMEPIAVAAP